MDNFTALAERLTGRNKDSRKVANNTYLVRRGDNIAHRLHATDILTWAPNDSVTLDSGGWQTVTTKERINRFAPCQLWQKNRIWYVKYFGIEYVYADGMRLESDGSVTGAGKIPPASERKAIRAFARAMADAVPLPHPGPGDCWFCLMFEPSGMRSDDHLDQHIEEAYHVPSLALNALREFGTSDTVIYAAFNEDAGVMHEYARERVRSSVERHILRRKGYAA